MTTFTELASAIHSGSVSIGQAGPSEPSTITSCEVHHGLRGPDGLGRAAVEDGDGEAVVDGSRGDRRQLLLLCHEDGAQLHLGRVVRDLDARPPEHVRGDAGLLGLRLDGLQDGAVAGPEVVVVVRVVAARLADPAVLIHVVGAVPLVARYLASLA